MRVRAVLKYLAVALALTSAYLLGYYLRSLPSYAEQPALTGDDPYIHLRYAEAILRGGLPANDTLRYYPVGFNTAYELPVVSWSIAFFSALTGLKPIYVASVLPAFIAPLVALPAYLLAKEVSGSKLAGVLAAFLASAAPGYIIRSFEGFVDKETFATPAMMGGLALALMAFNNSLREGRPGVKSIVLAITSGLLIGFAALAWKGFLYTYLVLAGYALLMLLLYRGERELSNLVVPYIITLVVSALIASTLTVRYGGFAFLTKVEFLAPVAVAAPLLTLRWLRRHHVLLILLAALITLAVIQGAYLRRLIGWLVGEKGLVRETVAESQPPDLTDLWNLVGLPLIAGLPALLPRELKGIKSSNYFFLISFFGVSTVLALSEVRLIMYLSLASSITAGVALAGFILKYWRELQGRLRRSGVRGLSKLVKSVPSGLVLSTLVAAFVVLSLFAIPTYSVGGRFVPHTLTYSVRGFPALRYWLEAAEWVKGNTGEDAVFLSWWDYGYLIQYYWGRATVVDPGNIYEWRNVVMAKFFMSRNESEALELIGEAFNLRGREVYVVVTVEEIPKSGAITFIAGEEVPPFQPTPTGWGITDPEVLLVKLVLGIEGIGADIEYELEKLQLVYSNPHLAIYRVSWNS